MGSVRPLSVNPVVRAFRRMAVLRSLHLVVLWAAGRWLVLQWCFFSTLVQLSVLAMQGGVREFISPDDMFISAQY